MFCTNCGVSIEKGASFCAKCGKPIGSAPTGATIEYILAFRLSRLGAKLIDGPLYIGSLIAFVVVNHVLDIWQGFLLLAFILGGVIPIIQIVLLTNYGQTIGKIIFNIRIVSVRTGQNAGIVRNWVLRRWVNTLLWVLPGYMLVDILFVFRTDRRCIHDLFSGTRVVK